MKHATGPLLRALPALLLSLLVSCAIACRDGVVDDQFNGRWGNGDLELNVLHTDPSSACDAGIIAAHGYRVQPGVWDRLAFTGGVDGIGLSSGQVLLWREEMGPYVGPLATIEQVTLNRQGDTLSFSLIYRAGGQPHVEGYVLNRL